jgi:hypothetical protein
VKWSGPLVRLNPTYSAATTAIARRYFFMGSQRHNNCLGATARAASLTPNDHVQSAAAQDVDRGSWLGPPLDCNTLFVGTLRPRPICPRATVARPAAGHLTASHGGQQSFLGRRSAGTEPGRGRTFRFAGGPQFVRYRFGSGGQKDRGQKNGDKVSDGREPSLSLSSWVFVSSVSVSGVPDFSAAPDVCRRPS